MFINSIRYFLAPIEGSPFEIFAMGLTNIVVALLSVYLFACLSLGAIEGVRRSFFANVPAEDAPKRKRGTARIFAFLTFLALVVLLLTLFPEHANSPFSGWLGFNLLLYSLLFSVIIGIAVLVIRIIRIASKEASSFFRRQLGQKKDIADDDEKMAAKDKKGESGTSGGEIANLFKLLVILIPIVAMLLFTLGSDETSARVSNLADLVWGFLGSFFGAILPLGGFGELNQGSTGLLSGVGLVLLNLAVVVFYLVLLAVLLAFVKAIWGKKNFTNRKGAPSFLRFIGKSIVGTFKSFISALLKIFSGPQKEGDKVNMLHVAAGFAALVSFLNSFYGIRRFYYSEDSVIPTIVAFSIAFAIQLAILVLGLRAGESWAENRILKADLDTNGKTDKVKRVTSFWFYCIPYLLFLTLSVAFSYTAMFRYYAMASNIHQNLYDEIASRVDETLDIFNIIVEMDNLYTNNRNDAISLLEDKIAHYASMRYDTLQYLQELANIEDATEGALWHHREIRDRFIVNTRGLENIAAIIRSLVDVDFEAVGRTDLTITNYFHYYTNLNYLGEWTSNPAHTFTSRALVFSLAGEQVVLGTEYSERGSHRGLSERFASTSINFSVEKGIRITLPDLDKYRLLYEIYNYFFEIRATIRSAAMPSIYEEDNPTPAEVSFRDLLEVNSIIDSVRGNIAEVYRGGAPQNSLNNSIITVRDLPRVTNSILERASNQEMAFQRLHEHIESSIDIYLMLTRFKAIDTPNNADTTPNELILEVRSYRNYAYSITNSDLRISFDALSGGRPGFNALSDSRITAIFLLLVCIIKDILPIAVGLTIPKAIYAFKMQDAGKLRKFGHSMFEARLVDFFSPPKNQTEREIYDEYINKLVWGIEPTSEGDAYKNYETKADEHLKNVLSINMDEPSSQDRSHLVFWLKNYLGLQEIEDEKGEDEAANTENDETTPEEEVSQNEE